MDRRTALKSIAASVGSLFAAPTVIQAAKDNASVMFGYPPPNTRFGWREDKRSLERFIQRNRYPFVSQLNGAIKGTGKGKKAFLHLALERVMGQKFVPHDQGAPDCVSHAAALGVDVLQGVQIAIQRQPQRWVAKAATEPIYGGSRVEVGGYNGKGGGSTGHWAAEWLCQYGVLLRQEYPGGHDFRRYSADKAVKMGRTGCPDALEPLAMLHPVKKTAICKSYEDLCDLIYNGSPVMVCSNVGFGSGTCRRDSDGFLTRKRRPWYHAMLFAAYDDEYRRPGALCFNSWGETWVTGPTRGHQPAGTFWIDAPTVTAMLRQGDSFAFSSYVGFPRVNIPPFILY
ncbi:MAG: C1 family peptidase [Planctomycetota bacterium]|jgi:hypothetical protein